MLLAPVHTDVMKLLDGFKAVPRATSWLRSVFAVVEVDIQHEFSVDDIRNDDSLHTMEELETLENALRQWPSSLEGGGMGRRGWRGHHIGAARDNDDGLLHLDREKGRMDGLSVHRSDFQMSPLRSSPKNLGWLGLDTLVAFGSRNDTHTDSPGNLTTSRILKVIREIEANGLRIAGQIRRVVTAFPGNHVATTDGAATKSSQMIGAKIFFFTPQSSMVSTTVNKYTRKLSRLRIGSDDLLQQLEGL